MTRPTIRTAWDRSTWEAGRMSDNSRAQYMAEIARTAIAKAKGE